jgi:6-pyruvoyl-tetrahydropterin synthase
MKNSWPKCRYSRTYVVSARHAMTHLGGKFAEPHEHNYFIKFCATHEIQPYLFGYTHSIAGLDTAFQPLIDRIAGSYLNDFLPMPPSMEALALWCLANTQPIHCDSVHIIGYGGYEVEVHRNLQTEAWMSKFRQ